jgi:hypothetical protein
MEKLLLSTTCGKPNHESNIQLCCGIEECGQKPGSSTPCFVFHITAAQRINEAN